MVMLKFFSEFSIDHKVVSSTRLTAFSFARSFTPVESIFLPVLMGRYVVFPWL